MPKKILIVSGSPKKEGNTAALIEWFSEGACANGAVIDIFQAATLKYKVVGCASCRQCQARPVYQCVVDDGVRPVLVKMVDSDVIVMATPLYFFSASAQLKCIIDRMFSLYKWNNATGAFTSPLMGKTLVLLGSSFEDIGLDSLAEPFRLTAEYTRMDFHTLLIPNAGVSGEIRKNSEARDRAIALGRLVG